MNDWEKTLISPDAPILEAIRIIDTGAMQIALVVDENRRLLGTLTDGDIRREILKGVAMQDPVRQIMNPNPTTAAESVTRSDLLQKLRETDLHQFPIVDDAGLVVGLETVDEILKPPNQDSLVVIMAGGLGTRLRPLTEECPKPMLRIGGRPILETILSNFIEFNFTRFYISVNYKGEVIEDHFKDGSRWGVNIQYLRENERMGTAGPLSLLPESLESPLIVMNADLLTKVNFDHLLNFHNRHKAAATMCVRTFDFQVPFGTVKLKEQRLLSIDEKPVQSFFINAGIYVLEPETLKRIPPNAFYDMPNLFEQLVEEGQECCAFPIREYWLDIARVNDYEKGMNDYKKEFESIGYNDKLELKLLHPERENNDL